MLRSMPSTIVKLCSGDARAWRVNQPVWLDEDGTVSRAVLPEEQDAISLCLARSQHVDQSFRTELELKKRPSPLQRAGSRKKEPAARVMFAFEVTWVGNRRVVTTYLGHLRYATGREVLSARLLAEHGECILHGPNGKCMGVLRDPLILERPMPTGRRVQWSKNPEQEALEAARRAELEERQNARRGRRASIAGASRKVELPALYSPEKCPNDCRGIRSGQAWATPKGAEPPGDNEHHPVCMHAEAWASTLVPSSARMVLYDLDSSRVMRDALPSEVEEASKAKENTGVSQVQLQGRIFAVLSAEDAETAAREARGEESPGSGSPAALGEASAAPSVEAAPPPPRGREDWPMLDSLRPQLSGRHVQKRDHISAADYLRHSSASAGGAG